MELNKPSFVDSPYFVGTPGNWHLKPGAPEEVQKEFERFIQALKPPDAGPDVLDIDLP